MSDDKLTRSELQKRLKRAEAAWEALRRGEVDLVVGTSEPMFVRLTSQVEEVDRLGREWRTTFDSMKDAVWVLDAKQRVVRSNRAAELIFQRPLGEMTGKHCWEIVHGTQEPIPECPILRMRQSLRRERMILQVGERWFEVTVDPVLDGNNALCGAVHIVSDITERKQVEEALRRSEDLFKNLFHHHSAVKLIIDPDTGRILDANHAAVIFYGWPRERILQRRIQDIDIARTEEITGAVEQARNGKQTLFEFRHRRSDGSIRDVSVFSSRIECDGKPLLHFIVHDITERKRSDAEVQRLTMAIEQVGDVVMLTDPEGVIQYVNPAFETVTGYTRLEALGQTPRMLKSGKHAPSFYEDLWATITGGRTWQGRMINKRKDDRLYTEEAAISPVKDASGRIVSFVAVKRDITEHLRIDREQARLQEQLQQAQKMESIGRLAGGVAHDCNNMLSIILGYGDIVHRKLHPGDPLKADVEEILKAGQRSADLTRQLLAFSRKQALQPEVLDINEVIRNIEKMLRRLIGEDIALDLSLSMDLSCIKVDPGQIEQVIMNLAINARDAMPTGGKLLIETSEVELDGSYTQYHPDVAPGKYVMLAISDTGCGMEKEVLAQIFDPFFTTKEKGKGTGLGLATVYGIVKQSGGHIVAYSEPGQGATFKIYLPVIGEQAEPRAEEAAQEESVGGGEHILVVEDEEALRGLLAAILSRSGYKVTLAANGGEALLLVEEQGLKPDLVITDVVMPGMSGSVLSERVRRQHPDLKVLFMSGYTDNAIVHHGILDQGTPFIQKPFTLRDIVQKVREVLQVGRRLPLIHDC